MLPTTPAISQSNMHPKSKNMFGTELFIIKKRIRNIPKWEYRLFKMKKQKTTSCEICTLDEQLSLMRILLYRKIGLFFLDIFVILCAFICAYFFRLGTFFWSDFPFGTYFSFGVYTTPIWIFFLIWNGRYEVSEKSLQEHFRIVAISSLAASLLFPLLFYFRQEQFFSRGIVLLLWGFGTLFLWCVSFLERQFEAWEVSKKRGIFKVLVVGAGRNAEQIIERLQKNSSRKIPMGIIAPYGTKKKSICGVPVLGKLDAIERICKEEKIEEIFLCDAVEQSVNILSLAEAKGIGVKISPEILGAFGGKNIYPEYVAGKPLLALRLSPLFGWGQFFKRIFDLFFSGIVLLLFSPVFLFRRTSRKKISIGEGKSIEVFVFKNSSTLPLYASVFQGKMSVVGPKALSSEEEEALFHSIHKDHVQRRYLLRPGIFSPVPDNASAQEQIEKEIRYILHWSFLEDMKILFQNIV